MATGLEVLSEAAPLPFPIDDRVERRRGDPPALPLPRPAPRRPGAALRLRSEVNRVAREILLDRDFVEVETPTLTRSTPEGARDFLVPARLRPGHWYALPQSPQLFKQLLMVAGMERYFQIARCYRDEDFRADRQPEFTQLDIEMSFVDQDDVIALTEALLTQHLGADRRRDRHAVPRLTYAEAMDRYGSDKPDLRFGLELVELHVLLRGDAVPGVPGRLRRCRRDAGRRQPAAADVRRVAGVGASSAAHRGLAYVTVGEDGELGGPVAKNLSDAERDGLRRRGGRRPGDCVFFAAGPAFPGAVAARAPPGSRSAAGRA